MPNIVEALDNHEILLNAAKKTLRENLHLCDGDTCTLYYLKAAVQAIDPDWELFEGEEL